jgi:hypothetical protein
MSRNGTADGAPGDDPGPDQEQAREQAREKSRKPGTWLPGQSGNPLGKPPGKLSVQAALVRALEQPWVVPEGADKGQVRTKLDQLARAMVAQAIGGSVPAAEWVGNRLEGRVASRVEVSGGTENQVVVVPWLPATEAAIREAQVAGRLPTPGQGDQDDQETVLPGEVEVLNHDLVEGGEPG